MKKSQVTKQLIESLVESKNDQYLEKTNQFVESVLASAVSDISNMTPFVKLEKCVFQPANEVYLGAVSQMSEFDYFLGIANPQIEMYSRSRKDWWKFWWREFRANWRLGKKKYKKKKNKDQKVPTLSSMEKYTISNFRLDLMRAVADYLSESSIVYDNIQKITMVGREDFGSNVRINVYVTVFDEETGSFKLLNEMKNKYHEINFGSRFGNLQNKVQTCQHFVDMVEVFNALYSKKYNKIPNQIVVESMIYACPDVLFDKDLFKTFVNVANYVRLVNPRDIASICFPEASIFEDRLITATSGQVDFSRIVNLLDRFKY